MSIKAVIFDIGNVLIEWQPERHYDTIIGPERRKAMFDEIDLHEMNDRVDRGHPFKETIYAEAAKYPKWEAEIRLWHDEWIHMASPQIDHSIHLLRALRKKSVPVFALSNFGVESFSYAETQYPFLTEFDRRYISGHMKEVKPHHRIYEMLEQDCGIEPDALLFTDDRADNIATAQARGWKTYLFKHPQGWADSLVTHGLLTLEESTL